MKSTHAQLTEWVREYTDALYAWALRKTGDSHLAEDLVQDTFLAAAEGLQNFEGNSSPKTWLMAILKYKIANHYRRAINRQTAHPGDDFLQQFFATDGRWLGIARPGNWQVQDGSLLSDAEFTTTLNRCIQHLPEAMQACIRLKFLEEKKGAEICQELGVSQTNYWQLVHRAKLQLRKCLDDNWFSRS
ncbi:MAG: sigma-70 family RNA polymerase sigma factor [Saprospiraceae bacterium]